MNIDGLGEALVDLLIDRRFIRDAGDLYALEPHRQALAELDRMGEKSVENLLKAIDASRGNDLHRLLGGLGIPWWGSGPPRCWRPGSGIWTPFWRLRRKP